MAAAGRRWQRCSSCGCRLMSASGQRPCCPSHGRGHHLPGRSTSIRALWRTAWVHESACWAVAVERWARRAPTRRRKGCFDLFVRYLTHLDLEPAWLDFDQYQSGIDHSLIDLESGMVNWYLRIPLSSLILLSSSGAVFSRDPCIGLLQCSGKRKNMAGNGRKQPEKVGYGKKRDGI